MSTTPSFPSISRYVYGTTRLGDASIPFDHRVAIARAAMDAGVWFHTSHQYGDALAVIRAAVDQDRPRTPRFICKIGWSNLEEIRGQIRLHTEALGVDRIDLAQLCLGGPLAQEYRDGGPCYEGFSRLKAEGLVGGLLVEIFPWTSAGPAEALRKGFPNGVIDGHIFYLNPLQRFASNELWDLLTAGNHPIVAMRTVSGGDVHRLRDVPGAAWKDYFRLRAIEVAPLYERSGAASWAEFCVRYALGFANVQATVGATSRPEGLQTFLAATRAPAPLPADIRQALLTLQRRWSDETDVHAEPWSM